MTVWTFAKPNRLTAAAVGAVAMSVGLGFGAFSPTAWSQPAPTSFQNEVLPILAARCVSCHNPEGVGFKAIGLDLRSYKLLMSGSTFGVAVVPLHPELSPLVAVLEPDTPSFKNLKMPPEHPTLPPNQIQVISRWIQEGAKDN